MFLKFPNQERMTYDICKLKKENMDLKKRLKNIEIYILNKEKIYINKDIILKMIRGEE